MVITPDDFINIKPGDLVRVMSWECEGVEPPWGVQTLGELESSELTKPFRRRKIEHDSYGIVVNCDELSLHVNIGISDDYDRHLVILVNQLILSVPIRFIHRVT